jgi:hypothetical protein
MGGTILYKNSLSKFRLNYNGGQTEWYDANTDVRTRLCAGACKEIPYFESNPEFFTKAGDTAGSDIIIDSRNCKIYNKAQSSSQPLLWVATDSSNLVCAALLKNGIQFTFSNVDANAVISDAELDPDTSCQDVNEACNSKLDIYFIGDESGSVTQAGFDSEINFMKTMLGLLDIQPGSVHVGLTFFSDDASLVQELTSNKTRLIDALNQKVYKQGKTCISCGLDLASVNFEGGVSRPGVPKVYVATTDGKNNKPEPQSVADQRLLEAANRSHAIVKANGGAVVAIGVGQDYNISELKKIVTKEKYILQVTAFDDLKGITNEVLASACEDSDYICDSCPTGFCICGSCQGCPGGCGNNDNLAPTETPSSAGLIAGIIIGVAIILAAAIGGVVWYLKRKKQAPVDDSEKRPTVDIEDRSERYSKLVRKFSVNEDKTVAKPVEE